MLFRYLIIAFMVVDLGLAKALPGKRLAEQKPSEKCPKAGSPFHYNICFDPVHGDIFKNEGETCDVKEDFIQAIKVTTLHEIAYINGIIKKFEKKEIRCKKQIERLNLTNLLDELNAKIVPPNIQSQNSVTEHYIQLSTIVGLIRYMGCELATLQRECCLKFPSKIYKRLEKRLLSKWFIIQQKCGDFIGQSHCHASIEITFPPKTCEKRRDLIYLLLRYVLHFLEESKSQFNMEWPLNRAKLYKGFKIV